MPVSPVLKLDHISKDFPGVIALHKVNFELCIGEVHILLGENGAGKSTLVKIISGAYRKTSGNIFLFGKQINIKNPRHAQELGISIIYQEFNLIPYLSVGENIFLGREPYLFPGIIDQNIIYNSSQKILNDLGVTINSRSLVKDLGVAQQQMVEVAKALSINARILIMDEPTSALTEKEIKDLFKTIRALKKKGVSIIYISHRLEELFEIGNRVTVLRDGEYIGTHSISDVSKSDLIRMMVNRELNEQFPKRNVQKGEEIFRVEKLNKNGILKNISFTLFRGEILGVAGLLGSGRTDLARAIFGADKIDSGSIYVKRKQRKINSPRDAIDLDIGLLTEDRKAQGLILNLSLKENICLPSIERNSKFGFVYSRKEKKETKKYISELRIKTPSQDQKVMYLSGGNQQKVVVSKWLCCMVDILIFDEPTRGIDVGSKVEIYQLMNQLTAEGTAIIMISSELPEILAMSDRIMVMHQGSFIKEYSAIEATQEKILQSALGAA
jgi:ribose transport system ATP-binding protein